jgi:hypothetical protein
MNARQKSISAVYGLITAMVIGWSTVSAAEPPAAPPEPSKETRAKMASAHERMATCLRSDKAIAECRSEMMKSCREIMGEQGCPMMGMGMHLPGMQKPGSAPPKTN